MNASLDLVINRDLEEGGEQSPGSQLLQTHCAYMSPQRLVLPIFEENIQELLATHCEREAQFPPQPPLVRYYND